MPSKQTLLYKGTRYQLVTATHMYDALSNEQKTTVDTWLKDNVEAQGLTSELQTIAQQQTQLQPALDSKDPSQLAEAKTQVDKLTERIAQINTRVTELKNYYAEQLHKTQQNAT